MGIISRLFRRNPWVKPARLLYTSVIEQSRHPVFYTDCCVDDTVEGRFDLLALHAFLVLRRLKKAPDNTNVLSQTFFDLMFADLDVNLRELGVGDMGMGRRIRKLAESFYGRIAAYDSGLDSDDDELLKSAIDRNLYMNTPVSEKILGLMAEYVRREDDSLAQQQVSALMEGQVTFGAPPHAQGAEQ